MLFEVTVSGRPAELAGAEAMVGLFINTLPLRVNLPPGATVAEWLRGLFRQNMELREHEHATLVDIQRWSELPRGEALFECLLAFENYPVDEALRAQQGSISARDVRFIEQTHYPLTIVAFPGPQLVVNASYDCARFDVEAVDRMLEYFSGLLSSIIASPEVRLGELSLLSREEFRRQVFEWNATAVSYPKERCIHQLFEEQVRRTPDAFALVFEDERLTYAELNGRANQVTHRLRRLGAEPETVVGICAERSAEMVTGILAILKSGGAYLPLDPANPAERLAFMLEDAGAVFVLTQEKLLGSVLQSASTICLDRNAALWAPAPKADLEPLGGPGNLAYVIYTSGSTGRPKGVEVAHRALANRVLWGISEFNLNPNDVVLQRTSPSFDVSAWEIFGSLAAGASVVIAGSAAFDPGHLIELVQLHSVTVIEVVPSLLHALLRTSGWSECHTLRLVCCGGEAMSDALRTEFAAALRGSRLYNMFGPTETTIDASYFACDALEGSYGDSFVPLGEAIWGAHLHVLDHHLNSVPRGVTGELFVGGAGLARGYHHQPGLTAERFIPDAFGEEGGRLYRTGDLARWSNDGLLEFRGRADHQVKLRGLRIELEEIEARLNEYAGVTCAAVVMQRVRKGESSLVAFVEAKDATVTPAFLRGYSRTVLPAFMVPSLWSVMAELPRDENGKLRRSSLPPVLTAMDQDNNGSAGKEDANAPVTETEVTLASIWANALGLPSVGRHDGFFDLGGHSLLAVQLTQKMRDALQADIPLVALFQFPTIATLAEWLQSQHSISISPLVKVRDGLGERPPLYLFHTGVGHVRGYQPLIAALDPADLIYGIQMRAIGNPAIDAEDFDAVIRDYVDLIRLHHPGGSYRLMEWSHGGLIAIGMAARLSELGADVSFVGLIDTDLPQELDAADWQGRLTEFLKDPEAQASLAALPDRESSELEQILSNAKPAERPAAAALWGREKGLWFNHVSPEALRLETSLWRHVAAIEDTFQPPRFAGTLHVWWAKASLLKGDVPAVDWARISGAKTHEMIVDADHHSIIANPNLHASIRQVLEWLDA